VLPGLARARRRPHGGGRGGRRSPRGRPGRGRSPRRRGALAGDSRGPRRAGVPRRSRPVRGPSSADERMSAEEVQRIGGSWNEFGVVVSSDGACVVGEGDGLGAVRRRNGESGGISTGVDAGAGISPRSSGGRTSSRGRSGGRSTASAPVSGAPTSAPG